MGRKSKARRDAKKKTRRRTANASAGTSVAGRAFGQMIGGPAVPGALFRRSCSECGSEDLLWMEPDKLAERVANESRASVVEGIAMLGRSAHTCVAG